MIEGLGVVLGASRNCLRPDGFGIVHCASGKGLISNGLSVFTVQVENV